MLDKDGYPTEKYLNKVREYCSLDNPFGIIGLIKEGWKYDSGVRVSGTRVIRLELHTFGWSGNEEIIQSLQSNFMFWGMYWQKSLRGGHYYFKLNKIDK